MTQITDSVPILPLARKNLSTIDHAHIHDRIRMNVTTAVDNNNVNISTLMVSATGTLCLLQCRLSTQTSNIRQRRKTSKVAISRKFEKLKNAPGSGQRPLSGSIRNPDHAALNVYIILLSSTCVLCNKFVVPSLSIFYVWSLLL